MLFKFLFFACSLWGCFSPSASLIACSRCTYLGPENTVVTGRTMDWSEDLQTEIYALPAGLKKCGSRLPNSVEWTSKYGSVMASGYKIATTDGINTEGLNANLLYLGVTDYGKPKEERQNLSILTWTQYFLDNYSTVQEAVDDFGQDKFNMTADTLPNGSDASVHLSITDAAGDNAIFEYIEGKLIVHHDRSYTVMTNEPAFDKQLALNNYWQNLNGTFLPGTNEPEDRFARAHFYLRHAPKTANEQQAISTVFSIIRNVSAPMTGRPNKDSTLWRSVSDLKRKIYYFESTDRPNIFWVDLKKLDLKAGAPIKKLPLIHNEIYSGEVSNSFIESKLF